MGITRDLAQDAREVFVNLKIREVFQEALRLIEELPADRKARYRVTAVAITLQLDDEYPYHQE